MIDTPEVAHLKAAHLAAHASAHAGAYGGAYGGSYHGAGPLAYAAAPLAHGGAGYGGGYAAGYGKWTGPQVMQALNDLGSLSLKYESSILYWMSLPREKIMYFL